MIDDYMIDDCMISDCMTCWTIGGVRFLKLWCGGLFFSQALGQQIDPAVRRHEDAPCMFLACPAGLGLHVVLLAPVVLCLSCACLCFLLLSLCVKRASACSLFGVLFPSLKY